MNAPGKQNRILIIKLGALGDVCLSMRYFERIRETHPDAHITMMTTAPFLSLCEKNPAFDSVIAIKRWRALDLSQWLSFISFMKKNDFDLVYDIQSNDRTSIMRRLSPATARKNWITFWKPLAQQRTLSFNDQVFDPGENLDLRPKDITWLLTDVSKYDIPSPFALIVPGCAPQHTYKRWPAQHYAKIARILLENKITPVFIGGPAERDIVNAITQDVRGGINLTSQTSYQDIASLAKQAAFAIGNDTGPMHLIALCGAKTLSLFSGKTDPARSAPRTPYAQHLRKEDIADIAVADVANAISEWVKEAR